MNYVLAWPVWWNPLHWLQHASATLPFVRDNNLLRLSQRERAGLQRGAAFMSQGRGYQAIQGTRPQTLGYGLQDSPAGGLRLLCSVRGVCDRAGKQWRVCAPRRWATACRLPCSLGGPWCCGLGQLPHVSLSRHLGSRPQRQGLACRGMLQVGWSWGIVLLPGQCAAGMRAAAVSVTGGPWHAAPVLGHGLQHTL